VIANFVEANVHKVTFNVKLASKTSNDPTSLFEDRTEEVSDGLMDFVRDLSS
jgi:hypothetical protein